MKPTPMSIVVNTGEQPALQHTIDEFFRETMSAIEERLGIAKMPLGGFERRSGEIAYTQQITDDRLTYLLYKDRPVACVLETRTEFNYVQYVFFRNIDGLDKTVK